MDFSSDKAPKLFVGSVDQKGFGSGKGQFNWATSVDCDAKGRVYVADHLNDRIQVFTPKGKHLKSIKVRRPTFVGVHRKTGEITVLSWHLGWGFGTFKETPGVKPQYTRFGPIENPKQIASCPLPYLKGYNYSRGASDRRVGGGLQYRAALDSWADKPTLWLLCGKAQPLMLLVEEKGKLKVKLDGADDIARSVLRAQSAILHRQRLYVNPADGMLYVGEGDSGVMKSFRQLVKVNPKTGKNARVDLPFTAEDMCFDLNGLAYLRSDIMVGRYDSRTWREVPFDYGEERKRVGFDRTAKAAPVISGLPLPATGRPGWFHLGGMAISAKGHLAVTCRNYSKATAEWVQKRGGSAPQATPEASAKASIKHRRFDSKYRPQIYPGRTLGWETHVWDKRGHLIHKDVTPGITSSDGVGIDKDDNIYILASPNRVLDGKPYFIGTAETLIKFRPGKARVLGKGSSAPVPLQKAAEPKRPVALRGRSLQAWTEGVDWMYGGLGFNNAACICWNARPALDLYARSFVPEVDHYSVAVLDTNGNLILRIGRYGNIDDGKPIVAAGGPPNTRKLGGDEVALMHAAYLATHSDRRLFVADAGNARILSIKLGYAAEERISLKNVPDQGATR